MNAQTKTQAVKTPAPAATEVAVARANRSQQFETIIKDLEDRTDQLKSMLGPLVDVNFFKQCAITALQKNPRLLDCSPRSIWLSVKDAATDGLRPDGVEGVIIDRSVYDKKTKTYVREAAWQRMKRGLIVKILRSGEVVSLDAEVVYENDHFKHAKGDNPMIEHFPFLGKERGKIIAAYAVAKLKNGGIKRDVLAIDQIYEIRDKFSDGWKAYQDGKIKTTPWLTSEAAMCEKTMIRQIGKDLPMDDAARRLIEHDSDDSVPDDGVLPNDTDKSSTPASRRPQLSDFQLGGDVIDHDPSENGSGEAGQAEPDAEATHAKAEKDGAVEAQETASNAITTESSQPPQRQAQAEAKPTHEMKVHFVLSSLRKLARDGGRQAQLEFFDTNVTSSDEAFTQAEINRFEEELVPE